MLIPDNVLEAIGDEYLARGGQERLPKFENYLGWKLFNLKWGIEEISSPLLQNPPSPLCKGEQTKQEK